MQSILSLIGKLRLYIPTVLASKCWRKANQQKQKAILACRKQKTDMCNLSMQMGKSVTRGAMHHLGEIMAVGGETWVKIKATSDSTVVDIGGP